MPKQAHFISKIIPRRLFASLFGLLGRTLAPSVMVKMLLLLSLLASVTPSSAYASAGDTSFCTSNSSLTLGNRVICTIHTEVFKVAGRLGPVYSALYVIFLALCAWQAIMVIIRKDPSEWIRGWIDLAGRFIMASVLGFPAQSGITTGGGGVPYKIYREVQNLSVDLVSTGDLNNSGFDILLKSLLQVGAKFWDMTDPMKKPDLSATSCSDANLGALFNVQPGQSLPTHTQAECIKLLLNQAAAAHSLPRVEALDNAFKAVGAGGGYGGLWRAKAVELMAQYEAKRRPSDPPPPTDAASKKIALSMFLLDHHDIDVAIPIAREEATLTPGGSFTDIGAYFSIARIRTMNFFETFTIQNVLYWIGMFFLWIAIGVGIVLFGAAYFLMTFTPVVVVPIGILIYQMMWVTAPLDGRVKSLLGTYKNVILPYAVAPAMFTFLSYFIVAILSVLPDVLGTIDPDMPLLGIFIVAALLVLLISLFGYKVLSHSLEWSKNFINLQLEPMLSQAMKIADFVGGMITGAAKMALTGVGVGGAIVGAGAVTASALGRSAAGGEAPDGMMDRIKHLGSGAGIMGRSILSRDPQRGGGDTGERASPANLEPGPHNPFSKVIPEGGGGGGRGGASGGGSAAAALAVAPALGLVPQTPTKQQVEEQRQKAEGKLQALEAERPSADIERTIFEKEKEQQDINRQVLMKDKALKGATPEVAERLEGERKALLGRSAALDVELGTEASSGLRRDLAERSQLKESVDRSAKKAEAMKVSDSDVVRQGVIDAITEILSRFPHLMDPKRFAMIDGAGAPSFGAAGLPGTPGAPGAPGASGAQGAPGLSGGGVTSLPSNAAQSGNASGFGLDGGPASSPALPATGLAGSAPAGLPGSAASGGQTPEQLPPAADSGNDPALPPAAGKRSGQAAPHPLDEQIEATENLIETKFGGREAELEPELTDEEKSSPEVNKFHAIKKSAMESERQVLIDSVDEMKARRDGPNDAESAKKKLRSEGGRSRYEESDELKMARLKTERAKQIAEEEKEYRAKHPFSMFKKELGSRLGLEGEGAFQKAMLSSFRKTRDGMIGSLAQATNKFTSTEAGHQHGTSLTGHAIKMNQASDRLADQRRKEESESPHVKTLENKVREMEKGEKRRATQMQLSQLSTQSVAGESRVQHSERETPRSTLENKKEEHLTEDKSWSDKISGLTSPEEYRRAKKELDKEYTVAEGHRDFSEKQAGKLKEQYFRRQNAFNSHADQLRALAEPEWKAKTLNKLDKLKEELDVMQEQVAIYNHELGLISERKERLKQSFPGHRPSDDLPNGEAAGEGQGTGNEEEGNGGSQFVSGTDATPAGAAPDAKKPPESPESVTQDIEINEDVKD